MEGTTESKDSFLPGENGGKEPCIPQVPLQDIPDPSGTCLLPGVFVMTGPSSVNVGPSGSIAGTHIRNISRPPAPSELCERLPYTSSTPCGAVREFPAADTLFAACSGRLSAVGHDRAYHHFLSRGETIWVPQDTIRISIQRSRYNTYLDTYRNTVRCQRDVMSSMKAETPVIRSPAHNLLLQWMEYLLLQLPMLSQDVTLLSYIRVFPSIWSEKKYVFQLVSFKNTCVYSFLWIAIHWVCHINVNRSDKISMHCDARLNRYTPIPVPFPTFDACPGIGPQIRAMSAPPGLRMLLPRHPLR